MSFIKGALDALNNLFETIFSRLDALGDRTEVLESDFEKFAISLDEAATHAAQYAVDLALEDLDLESNLSSAKSLQDDIESLKFSVHELENDMHPLTCQDARIDSLERDLKRLEVLVRDQDKVIKALLKALEWQPPKD